MTANLARALAADPTKQVHFFIATLRLTFFSQKLFVVFQFLHESHCISSLSVKNSCFYEYSGSDSGHRHLRSVATAYDGRGRRAGASECRRVDARLRRRQSHCDEHRFSAWYAPNYAIFKFH